jgi:hypothetical protein
VFALKVHLAEVELRGRLLCNEVFMPEKPWMPATTTNFEALPEDMPGRFGFAGKVACENIRRRFVGKHMSGRLKRAKGMANPILYSFD